MKNTLTILFLAFLAFSCKDDKKTTNDLEKIEKEETANVFNDSDYALDTNYEVGDVRRYGMYPDSSHAAGHPFTKKTRIETIIDLAQNHDIEMKFPQGYYNSPLIIKGKKNVTLDFQDAEFGGIIQIIEDDSTQSENIVFKGNLITYAGFFSRKSNNIKINDLVIKSNKEKSLNNLLSKGCQIYAGSKNISINNLIVEGLGSGGEKYKYVSAALAIEGWNDNPENIQIKKVDIKSSDRHGVYITGKDHLIGEVNIDAFGLGSSKDMRPMGDAKAGEEKAFKALWVNKCYDSFIEKITINEKNSKGKYTAHFDYGNKANPLTIGTLKVINDNSNIGILEEDPNGVVIEVQD